MKIEITHYDEKHSTEYPDDCTIDDTMKKVCDLLVLTGFHINSINNWIVDKADELNLENK